MHVTTCWMITRKVMDGFCHFGTTLHILISTRSMYMWCINFFHWNVNINEDFLLERQQRCHWRTEKKTQNKSKHTHKQKQVKQIIVEHSIMMMMMRKWMRRRRRRRTKWRTGGGGGGEEDYQLFHFQTSLSPLYREAGHPQALHVYKLVSQ